MYDKTCKERQVRKGTQKDSKIHTKTFNNEIFLSLEIFKAKG